MESLTVRLSNRTDRVGGHARWTGAAGADGTPQIRIKGRLTTVRRVVWEQAHGPLPPGATVAACPDEPRCILLEHLALGRKRRSATHPPMPESRRRGRRGSGSMRQLRPGVWELAVSTSGIRRYRTVHGTESEATSLLTVFAAEATGRFDDTETLVIAYLAHLEQNRSPTTLRRYRQLWRQWLSPALGASSPDELTRRSLQETLAAMAEARQSRSSIHQAAVLLSGSLAWAKRNGHLYANPALGLPLPDGTRLAPPRQR
jgi:hypothetical protein